MYYRERDKDGAPVAIEDPEAEWQRKEVAEDLETPDAKAKAKAKYLTMALAFGMSLEHAEAKWKEAEEKHHGRA